MLGFDTPPDSPPSGPSIQSSPGVNPAADFIPLDPLLFNGVDSEAAAGSAPMVATPVVPVISAAVSEPRRSERLASKGKAVVVCFTYMRNCRKAYLKDTSVSPPKRQRIQRRAQRKETVSIVDSITIV